MDLTVPPPFPDERQRLSALAALDILDTKPDRELDELTKLAAAALGVKSAAISLIDGERQWFKSRHNIPFAETSRDVAFCSHAVEAQAKLIVPDATQDARFRDNPLVTVQGGIRFYAGTPLFADTGECIGTLCVFDPAPRDGLSAREEEVLEQLTRMSARLIASHRFRRLAEIAAEVVKATSDAVLACDRDGLIVYWNEAAERMFGHSSREALGRPVELIIPSRFAQGHHQIFARAVGGAPTRLVGTVVELTGARADGSEFPLELSLTRWGDERTSGGFAAIVRDISDRRALERSREEAQSILRTVIDNLPVMLFVKDVQTRRYRLINRTGEKIIGRPAKDIVGLTDHELFPDYAAGFVDRDDQAVSSEQPHVFESEFVGRDGRLVSLKTTRIAIEDSQSGDHLILGISEDVTETRKAEAEIFRLARYDTLTGLFNRASFTEFVHQLVRKEQPFALLSVDLDRFKAVNDLFGHVIGDEVLQEVGNRLLGLVGEEDHVARLGGDEFAIVLVGDDLRGRATRIAQGAVDAVARPIVTAHAVAHTGASLGIALFPEDGATPDELREHADLALYRGKTGSAGGFCWFSSEMDDVMRDRRKLESDLREAIGNDEIALLYQPILSARTGAVTSVEALARWKHPVRGPVPPDCFITLAEEIGLIEQLGERLLERACRDATHWPSELRVAVNMSPLQFQSGNLVATVYNALSQSGLEPGRLQLEVTEGLVIRDVQRTFEQLEQLRGLGIKILIDDFGVGYSSLSYFQRFPFDKVKIDKSFVQDVETSNTARAIVRSVVGLGREIGMAVVAEGVETEDQMRILVEIGCTHLQGFLFGGGLPAHAIGPLAGARKAGALLSAAQV